MAPVQSPLLCLLLIPTQVLAEPAQVAAVDHSLKLVAAISQKEKAARTQDRQVEEQLTQEQKQAAEQAHTSNNAVQAAKSEAAVAQRKEQQAEQQLKQEQENAREEVQQAKQAEASAVQMMEHAEQEVQTLQQHLNQTAAQSQIDLQEVDEKTVSASYFPAAALWALHLGAVAFGLWHARRGKNTALLATAREKLLQSEEDGSYVAILA